MVRDEQPLGACQSHCIGLEPAYPFLDTVAKSSKGEYKGNLSKFN